MKALIDCGTTFTRLYILNDKNEIVAEGRKKVGVKDTAVSGSRQILREGISELFRKVLKDNGIRTADIQFAVSSGMITSEIGLVEIPHLVAPVSEQDLADNIYVCEDPDVIPLGIPLLFIRGIRNNYGDHVKLDSIRRVDFLRGEEVQCIGIAKSGRYKLPLNVVVLSSHTKIIHIDSDKRICGCMTTLSGQLYEAINTSTSVGKSLRDEPGEADNAQAFTRDEISSIAIECVNKAGIVRTLLMPRFMQVLLQTTGDERRHFLDAAIAADDMKAFEEFRLLGFDCSNYLLFGQQVRCDIYSRMIREHFPNAEVKEIFDDQDLSRMTVDGILAVLQASGRD